MYIPPCRHSSGLWGGGSFYMPPCICFSNDYYDEVLGQWRHKRKFITQYKRRRSSWQLSGCYETDGRSSVVVAFYRAGLLIFPSTEWKALIPFPPKAQTLSLLLLYVHTLRWTQRDAATQRESRRDAYPQSMTSRWAVAGCMSGQESSCGAQWVSFHASCILHG